MKLIALDLDGTTLRSDSVTISPANLAAIKKAMERGIYVVIATGRMLHRLPKSLEALDGIEYLVTSNGAMVYHYPDRQSKTLIYQDAIQRPTVYKAMDILDELDIYTEAYCDGLSYTQRQVHILCEIGSITETRRQMLYQGRNVVPDLRAFLHETDSPVEKINLPYVPADVRGELTQRLESLKSLCITSSFDKNMELNSKTANKGTGLGKICDSLKILSRDVLVIGDSNNDLDMFRFAGTAVAMANSDEQVKQAAQYVTASNDEDGVAQAIEKYL